MKRHLYVLWLCMCLIILGLAWIVWQAPPGPLTNAERIWFCQSELRC